MELGVLGGTTASIDGVAVGLGTRKQRALLALLALHVGESVSTSRIVDALWPDGPPPGVTTTLQTYVSGLRKVLEPGRAPRALATVLVTTPTGYALHLDPAALDASRLVAATRDAERFVGVHVTEPWFVLAGASRSDAAERLVSVDAALATWRGEPFADLGDDLAVGPERSRLHEVRASALEHRAVLAVALGRHAEVASDLERLLADHPHRETAWLLRAVALVRSGRQVEGLATLRTLRRALVDELGLEPGPRAAALEQAILRHEAPVERRTTPVQTRLEDPWPLVGRAAERRLLAEALELAEQHRPQLVQVIGEPGIGKSRLSRELVHEAESRGFVAVTAACSQDEGAPPLWPWTQVLEQLTRRVGAPMPDLAGAPDAADAGWGVIATTLHGVLRDHRVLLVLDDLHWADTSSLKVLRQVLESTVGGALVLVATRRPHPAPTGVAAEVAEAFARRHAHRLELEGLDLDESAELVAGAATALDAAALRRVHERTAGNPFFLVELARAGESVPGAVHDVVGRRVGDLPDDTREVLLAAAVVGRRFDLVVVEQVVRRDADAVVDALEPALVAGLLLETDDPEVLRFSHAVVRDVVAASTSAARRARLHAATAAALEHLPGHPTDEVARHWREAGPRHAPSAWRAARSAADHARGLRAWDEVAEQLGWAVRSHALDPDALDPDRYDLLMARVEASRLSGRWADVSPTVLEAIAVAERMGDPERAAVAAISTTEGALWHAQDYGEVDRELVRALERTRAALPPGDGELRCRVLVSLAIETYYDGDVAGVDALAAEAVEMARRLDDPRLLAVVLQGACSATWRPSTAPVRLRWADESVRLARAVGDDNLVAFGLCFAASAAGELGDVPLMEARVREAADLADELGLVPVAIFVEVLMLAWRLLRGEDERYALGLDRVGALAASASVPNLDDAVDGLALFSVGWVGGAGALGDAAREFLAVAKVPLLGSTVASLWRVGDVDDARDLWERFRPALDLEERDYVALLTWCFAAEVAFRTDDAPLAADVEQRLAPFSGWSCSAGSAGASGPVDLYLALAAVAQGRLGDAGRWADAAEEQCRAWGTVRPLALLRAYRAAHGF